MRRLTFRPHRIEEGAGAGIEPAFNFDAAYETAVHTSAHPRTLTAAAGLEPAHSRIPGERSEALLSYAAKIDREGVEPSQEVCKTSMLPFTSPARGWSAEVRVQSADLKKACS